MRYSVRRVGVRCLFGLIRNIMHRVPHPSTCFPTDSDFCFLFLSEDLLEMLDGVDVFFKMDVNSQLLTPQMSRSYSPIMSLKGNS